MGNSLHDQLIKAGLVNEKQAKNAYKEKQRKKKLERKGQAASSEPAISQTLQKQAERKARDRKLNQIRQKEARHKSIAAQIKQMVDANKVAVKEGDISYNFSVDNKIRRIMVDAELRKRLLNGALAIVYSNKKYEIVPKAVAEKISQRDPNRFVLWNEPKHGVDKNDPYADYQVPDDLIW